MQSIWQERQFIKSYETGPDKKLKLSSLFNYIQEAAGNHATHLQVGFEELQSNHWFWVLSRIKLEIIALPKWGDTIILTTWPKGIDKLFAMRDFEISDEKGNILIKASSYWLVVEAEKLKLHKIKELGISIPDNNGKAAILESIEKIKIPYTSSELYKHKVTYSELDANLHVNNGKYIEWIQNSLNQNEVSSNTIKSIQVNYLSQAVLNDIITLHQTKENDLFFFEAIKEVDKEKVFQAVIEFTNQHELDLS